MSQSIVVVIVVVLLPVYSVQNGIKYAAVIEEISTVRLVPSAWLNVIKLSVPVVQRGRSWVPGSTQASHTKKSSPKVV